MIGVEKMESLQMHDIPTIKIEGVSRFRRKALDEFMQQHEK